MQIEKINVGSLRTNCYFIIDDKKNCIVVDPGDEFLKIEEKLKDLNLVGILVTHSHYDHIGALEELEEKYNLTHNKFQIDGFNFEVIKTPGHRYDSVTFYFETEKIMFTGDFLFKDTYGRIDLEGSNPKDMYESLAMIKKYPDDVRIFPGHGKDSNLGYEKSNIDNYLNYYYGN
ncbi:MAG: MBL fold metallo-hydrolase [bacterium]